MRPMRSTLWSLSLTLVAGMVAARAVLRGVEWIGDACRYGRGDVQAARHVASTYPRGTSHQVFVKPARPVEAFPRKS